MLASTARAQIPPSVEFRVPKPPTLAVSDSGPFLGYELHVTNLTATPLLLRRVEVLDAEKGTSLATLADSGLLRVVSRVGPQIPADQRLQIGGGLRAYVYLWFLVDQRSAPNALRHRLTFKGTGPDTSVHMIDGPVVRIDRNVAMISPPLRGEWVAVNGPSNVSGHRRLVLGLGGQVASGQRFGIDFLQVDSTGSSSRPGADRLKNDSYYAYGSDILAVADGIVVETKDSIPENVPGATSRAVPINLETVGGNHLIVDVGQSHYAFYAHVQPGSLRVKVGDRVKRGQVLASLGNSGNSTEPHLHFHMVDGIASGSTTLGAEGIPYAADFELVGRCALTTKIDCTRAPTPVAVKRGIPLQNEMVRFPR
jgi:hypothetical protein